MNNSIITNKISYLEPVSCNETDCHYNKWLVNVQKNPGEFIVAAEEDEYIKRHQLIKKFSEINIQHEKDKLISTQEKEIIFMFHEFIRGKVSFDFFDATFKHFTTKNRTVFNVLFFTPEVLIGR